MKNRTNHQTEAPWKTRWIVLFSLFTFHCSLFICSAGAQSFTQNIQQSAKGEGTVTIHQSMEIDELVNAPASPTKKPAATTAATPKQPEKKADKPTAKTAPAVQATTPHHATATVTETEREADDDTPVATPLRTRKVTGYRVQAFAGGNTRADRQKAEQTANAIRTLFPDEAVYTHFYNPRWICRVGNYTTYEEARNMLNELRKLGYSSATIVKGKVTVAY